MSDPKNVPAADALVRPTDPGAIELSEQSLQDAVGGAAVKTDVAMKWTPADQKLAPDAGQMKWTPGTIAGADGSV